MRRACRAVHNVGPLFGRNRETAEVILEVLAAGIPSESFYLDSPVPNAAAVALMSMSARWCRSSLSHGSIRPEIPCRSKKYSASPRSSWGEGTGVPRRYAVWTLIPLIGVV